MFLNWQKYWEIKNITVDIGKFRRYSEELQGILGNFGDIKKNYRGYTCNSDIQLFKYTCNLGIQLFKYTCNLDIQLFKYTCNSNIQFFKYSCNSAFKLTII